MRVMEVLLAALVTILFAAAAGIWWFVGIKQLREGVIYSHLFAKKWPRDKRPIRFGCAATVTLAIALLVTLISLGLCGVVLSASLAG